MNRIEELKRFVLDYGTAPTLEEMERRSLKDKGIAGPSGAHVIEEVHVPYNFAYITATTGTTAFQNLVGVTHTELPGRRSAAERLFGMLGIEKGARMLVSYPPLVSVFSQDALTACGIGTDFLLRSDRDAFLLAACEKQPAVIVGESSFLKRALQNLKGLGILDLFPRGTVFLAAGTPLDVELVSVAKELVDGKVHDLYGCQEFGFLALDGIPLRDDLTLLPRDETYYDLFVGGLPTGDCFAVSEKGHICNPEGKILTYSRKRRDEECEVVVKATTAKGRDTILRLRKTILRIKARIIRLDPELELGAERTRLLLTNPEGQERLIEGPEATGLFDRLLEAQVDYQHLSKSDPLWLKNS